MTERVIAVGTPHIVLGIDPYINKIPPYYLNKQKDFIKAIEEWVKDLLVICKDEVVGVKFQMAFFEFLGSDGVKLCYELIKFAKEKNGYFVILDAKRNDIPDISNVYAETYLSNNFIDAITTTPYFGLDSLDTFLKCAQKYGKIIFVVVYSSNRGAMDIQKIKTPQEVEFWEYIVKKIYEVYREKRCIGFVIGATNPVVVRKVQDIFHNVWILSPGFGPQGADTSAWKNVYLKPVSNILFTLSRTLTIPDPVGHYTTRSLYINFVKDQLKMWKEILGSLYQVS
ncbi:MAG: orotidine-5'-phosphate decarboxylase [Planctomycetota bacterium]